MRKHRIVCKEQSNTFYRNYISHVHKRYCKDPKFKVKQPIVTNIIRDFHDEIFELMMYKNFCFEMFDKLGTLNVMKREVKPRFDENGNLKKGLKIDWIATRELKKRDPNSRELIYHENKHTNQFVMFVFWHKPRTDNKIIRYYQFRTCRKLNRRMAEILKQDGESLEFYIIGDKQKRQIKLDKLR